VLTLKYYSSLSFYLDGIFLGFWKEKFFLYNFTYFFPKILTRGWAITNSLTIYAFEDIFGKRISLGIFYVL